MNVANHSNFDVNIERTVCHCHISRRIHPIVMSTPEICSKFAVRGTVLNKQQLPDSPSNPIYLLQIRIVVLGENGGSYDQTGLQSELICELHLLKQFPAEMRCGPQLVGLDLISPTRYCTKLHKNFHLLKSGGRQRHGGSERIARLKKR